jgi:serine/threonine-protein kinase HipA
MFEKREHSLSFPSGAGFLPPDGRTLQRTGENLKIEASLRIIDTVRETVSGWKKVFQYYNVPESDILRLEWGHQPAC